MWKDGRDPRARAAVAGRRDVAGAARVLQQDLLTRDLDDALGPQLNLASIEGTHTDRHLDLRVISWRCCCSCGAGGGGCCRSWSTGASSFPLLSPSREGEHLVTGGRPASLACTWCLLSRSVRDLVHLLLLPLRVRVRSDGQHDGSMRA